MIEYREVQVLSIIAGRSGSSFVVQFMSTINDFINFFYEDLKIKINQYLHS